MEKKMNPQNRFAPLGTFLCRVCRRELYDAKNAKVENSMLVFDEYCDEKLIICCPNCLTRIGYTERNKHCVHSSFLTYFST